MTQPVPAIVRGQHFPSIRAACRHFGIPYSNAKYHLNRWGHLDRIGTGQYRASYPDNRKPITIYGRVFASRTDAAAALGISVSQLRRWSASDASPALQDALLAAVMAYDRRAAA